MTAHEFLSDTWIAETRRVAAEYHGRIDEPLPPMRLNVVVTQTPFDGDRVLAHVNTTGGELVLEIGHLDRPELTITADYGTARKLFVDQDFDAVVQAFFGGKVTIQGDMTKVLALQAVEPHPLRLELAARIVSMTR